MQMLFCKGWDLWTIVHKSQPLVTHCGWYYCL